MKTFPAAIGLALGAVPVAWVAREKPTAPATAGSSPIVVVGESHKCVATPIVGNWASVQSPARVRLEVSALPQ